VTLPYHTDVVRQIIDSHPGFVVVVVAVPSSPTNRPLHKYASRLIGRVGFQPTSVGIDGWVGGSIESSSQQDGGLGGGERTAVPQVGGGCCRSLCPNRV